MIERETEEVLAGVTLETTVSTTREVTIHLEVVDVGRKSVTLRYGDCQKVVYKGDIINLTVRLP